MGNGILVYTKENEDITSFIMGYSIDKTISSGLGDGKYMHVWMAGTDPNSRGKGLMPKCFTKIEEFARTSGKFKGISLNTNTIEYKAMFHVATKKFKLNVYKEGENGKVFLKKEF